MDILASNRTASVPIRRRGVSDRIKDVASLNIYSQYASALPFTLIHALKQRTMKVEAESVLSKREGIVVGGASFLYFAKQNIGVN